MNKQIIQRWQSLLLAAIALIIMVGASSPALAQKSFNAKFPKPDFTAMEEYWEVVDYEYDFTGRMSLFNIVAKKKQEKVPRYWRITWRDEKGVKVTSFTLMFEAYNMKDTKVGDSIRASSYAPEIKDIPRIKSVVVTEHEDPNWARYQGGAHDTLLAALIDVDRYQGN